MKTIYLATAETRNFSFQAIGESERSAKASLLKGLRLHGEQYNLEPTWWEEWAEIVIEPLTFGEVYRDGSLMKEIA
jgi:hypothetical protein